MGYDKLAHWLSQNYQWIFSGIGVLIVAFIIQRLSSRKESKHEATIIAGSTLAATGQHNTQSVAAQNFHAESIHIGHAVAAPAAPQPTKTERTLPNLAYAGAKRKNVFVGPWQHTGICDPVTQEQRDKSVHALVVKVENRIVPGGSKITSALNVIAKLKFRHKNGATERAIDYGVWLNSPCNHYVFPSEKYGLAQVEDEHKGATRTCVHSTDPTKPIGRWKEAWESAKTQAGVQCRFHDLRHTGCTRMLEAGVPFLSRSDDHGMEREHDGSDVEALRPYWAQRAASRRGCSLRARFWG